jgi:membrane dipeptidase
MRFPFVFGLTLSMAAVPALAATNEAAHRLAQDSIIVDTHIDAPGELMSHWDDLGVATPGKEFDSPRARQGGLAIGFMSIYTSPDQDDAGTAWQSANTQIDAVEAMVGRHPDKFAKLTSPADVARLRKGGKVLLALGMENGAPIGDDLSQLAAFHKRGVRYITLAHSANNRISDSSYALQKKWGGLSPFGEKVVAEMNRLGIMVDVSHLSDDSIRDVLAATNVPVIASHSGMRHFTPGFERNISDELAKAVAAEGGVVQLVFGTGFIDAKAASDLQASFQAEADFDRENAALVAAGKPARSKDDFEKAWKDAHPMPVTHIEAVLDQIDYAVKLIGVDHVGIGSDFDGVSGNLPVELKSVADYPNLVAGLQARGHSDADIRKILGGNLLRVWTAVEKAATAR